MSGKGYINKTVCNKNLFNFNKFLNKEEWKLQSDLGRYFIYYELPKYFFKKIFATCELKGSSQNLTFCFSDTNLGNHINDRILNNGTIEQKTYDFSSAEHVYIIISNPNSISSNKIEIQNIFENYNIMVSSGYTATNYVPHEEQTFRVPIQQPFRAVGNIRDRFVKIDGVWKEKHNVGRYIFTGNENWILKTENVKTNTYQLNDASLPFRYLLSFTSCCFSNYYNFWKIVPNGDDLKDLSEGLYLYYNSYYTTLSFYINDSRKLNLINFKTWLTTQYSNGTPVYVDYQLATPTYIDCTPEQTSILDKMYPFVGYNDTTNFYSTDDLVPFAMDNYQGTPSPQNLSDIYSTGDRKNLINLSNFNITYSQEMEDVLETDFDLKPNFFYSFEFNYNINSATTDISYSLGYGVNGYIADIVPTTQYTTQTTGTNTASFQVPSDVPEGAKLYIKFVKTSILADVNIDISNIQLEYGSVPTSYQSYDLFNIDLFSAGKNLYNYNKPMYIKATNATYSNINNGYNVICSTVADKAFIEIGYKNVLTANSEYAISYFTSGQFSNLELYTTFKDSEKSLDKIEINNGVFTAPEGIYDLKLVIYVDSTAVSNSLEIWNVQMEYGNTATEYEQYNSNNAILTLDAPLRGIGNVRDIICLETINLINPNIVAVKVEESKDYYFSNNTGITVTYTVEYRNSDNNVISTESLTSGILHTPANCTTITFENITSEQVVSNKMQIEYGSSYTQYLPYIEQPCLIRNIGETEFVGAENWAYVAPQNFTLNNSEVEGCLNSPHNKICNYFEYTSQGYSTAPYNYLCENTQGQTPMFVFRPESNLVYDLTTWKQWLAAKNNSKEPLRTDYQLENPTITFLTSEQIKSIKSLFTYSGITNVGTYNNSEADLTFNYVNDIVNQKTQNAYVLLKCFNNNLVPYIIHSNYIEIPSVSSKVFIWTRRQGNLFDLQIENLDGEVEGV